MNGIRLKRDLDGVKMNRIKYINETTHTLQFNFKELFGASIFKELNDDGTYHILLEMPIYEELFTLYSGSDIIINRYPILSDKPCGKLKCYCHIDIPRCEIEKDVYDATNI